jgi:hypothetical protein
MRKNLLTGAALAGVLLLASACGVASAEMYDGGSGGGVEQPVPLEDTGGGAVGGTTAEDAAEKRAAEEREAVEKAAADAARTAAGDPTTWDAEPKSREWGDGQLTITDVRFAAHEGFDRIVFDLEGEGEPSWLVQYTDAPTQDGSGFPIEMLADNYLWVNLFGMQFPLDSEAVPFEGRDAVGDVVHDGDVRFEAKGVKFGGVAADRIAINGWFEGHIWSFIGVNGDTAPAFNVTLLESPMRLVIDIAH